ncbi:transcriptional regulator [Duganella dendranthematis]|jgi:DNA-binding phage protein|uniref:Transcriptional regulator n=1 Tax=Duganella dendranthematis TaxID=2728021 RepID=A0ABX6MCK1_9BURK|nr:transcriptional regulator [Duganella dendranthematis]QJD91876.1 transcriptional regulator [Duganella dendranthematis]
MRDRDHDTAMAELLAADHAYATELLRSVLSDGNAAELDVTLRQMWLAFGIEGETTSLKMLLAVVDHMGMQLSIAPNESRG